MRDAVTRIGPNAIVQLGAAFAAREETGLARIVYGRAACPALLDRPPAEMVDERIVARLFGEVVQSTDA